MNCPRCRRPVEIRYIDKIEVDFCSSCWGLWCDAGELGSLTNMAVDLPPLDSYRNQDSTTYPCPKCDGKLYELHYDKNQTIRLDQCQPCNGIWLDFGELEKIRSLHKKVDKEILGKLFPTTKERAIVTLIDVAFAFTLFIICVRIFSTNEALITPGSILIAVFFFILYETILISRSATLGQFLIGTRVRKDGDVTQKLSSVASLLRTLYKLATGLYSLYAMHFSHKRRSIHDIAANSVVFRVKPLRAHSG